MTVITIFLIVLLLEIVALIICFTVLVLERIFRFFSEKRKKRKEEHLSSLILRSLQSKQGSLPKIPRKLQKLPLLSSVISSFDSRFQGGRWEEIKKEIISKVALPRARRWAKSFFWHKRFIAAKCFSFYSQPQDKLRILRLLRDRSFLVESAAALAIVKQEKLDYIELLLKKMSAPSAYTRLYFKDILLQGSNAVFFHIEKILNASKSPEIRIACLDILSARSMPLHSPIIKKEANSKNAKMRLSCITLHAHNPQIESESILQKAIADEEVEIRREAAYGLRTYNSKKTREKLIKALEDEDWFVRFNAAKSLQRMGDLGEKALRAQIKAKSKVAEQIASYVLHLTSG